MHMDTRYQVDVVFGATAQASPDVPWHEGADARGGLLEVEIAVFDPRGESPRSCTRTLRFTRSRALPRATLVVPARLFAVQSPPATTRGHARCVPDTVVQQADTIILELKQPLYARLTDLRSDALRCAFLQQKYGIKNNETILHRDSYLAHEWCYVRAFVPPADQATIDFERTQIVLVPQPDAESGARSGTREALQIECLGQQVPRTIIEPEPIQLGDNCAFVHWQTLRDWQLSQGTQVPIRLHNTNKLLYVKIYAVSEPHRLQENVLYVTPEIMYNVPDSPACHCELVSPLIEDRHWPLARSVALVKLACWDQLQKSYEPAILTNLKRKMSLNDRPWQIGDRIAVPFDSNVSRLLYVQAEQNADFYRELDHETALGENYDKLVWFQIEEVEFESDDSDAGIPFLIDPELTTLNVKGLNPMELKPLQVCDYYKYYSFAPIPRFDDFATFQRLENLVSRNLQGLTIMLHSESQKNVGKCCMLEYLAQKLGFHFIKLDCLQLTSGVTSLESLNKFIGLLRAKLDPLLPHLPKALILLSHFDTIFPSSAPEISTSPESAKLSSLLCLEVGKLLKDISTQQDNVLTLVATVNDLGSIPLKIRATFMFEIQVKVPNEKERKFVISQLLNPYILNFLTSDPIELSPDVDLRQLALQTAGLTPLDIASIVSRAKISCRNRKTIPCLLRNVDMLNSINEGREQHGLAIGAPKIPNVAWEDVGGVDLIKSEILESIDMPLKHPELYSTGMKRKSGILFYGPPGTGKTLMAKAIASNFALNFFSIKGPELLNMYIGESEANVRRIFQRARDSKPCVILFDEIDSVAPKRGNQGDSGGVIDRIVSQLLAELDGMSNLDGEGIFVIGATNRPDLLDNALLRPGRFDRLMYLGIADTNEKQAKILEALTRKFSLDSNINLLKIAELCPFNYTGADFYALCTDAMMNAIKRTVDSVDSSIAQHNKNYSENISISRWFEKHASPSDYDVIVTQNDFILAQSRLISSISQEELEHYLQVRNLFED